MNTAAVTDSVSSAWDRTEELLLEPFDVSRWLKLGFIALLGAAGARHGTSLNIGAPGPSGDGGGSWTDPGSAGMGAVQAAQNTLQWLSDNIAGLVLMAVGLTVAGLVIALALVLVRSVFRFIFVEAVAAPREPGIGDAWSRHLGRGVSLVGWYLLMGLAPAALVIIALVPIAAGGALVASGEPLSAVLGAGGLVGVIGLLVLAPILMALLQAVTQDFLVPAMYAARCGLWAGWRRVLAAWRGELWNVVLFYLLKLVLLIVAGIASAIIGVLAVVLLIPAAASLLGIWGAASALGASPGIAAAALAAPALIAMMLGGLAWSYLLQCALLPVSVFFQAYSLSFVGRLDPALRTID